MEIIMDPLAKFTIKTADWREQIRRNSRRTRFVISLFILIYLSLGLFIDLFTQMYLTTQPPLAILKDLISFRIFPLVTLAMAIFASIAILITFSRYDKIILLGTDAHAVDNNNAPSSQEKLFENVVEEMKVAAGLRYKPKLFVINAPYMNAFASGYSERSALIAVTQGLLDKLDRQQLQAVVAHELSHIRHQDIKLTLTASVLTNCMLIVFDQLFRGAIYHRRGNNPVSFILLVIRWLLPLVTLVLLLFLSRSREFMADAGAVKLMRDNSPLAHALIKIDNDFKQHQKDYHQTLQRTPHENLRRAAYLYSGNTTNAPVKDLFSRLFSTHPRLYDRLKAIGFHKTEN